MNYEPMFSRKTEEHERYYDAILGGMSKRRKIVIAAALAALIVVIGLSIYMTHRAPADTTQAVQLPNVTVMTAGHTSIARVVSTTGTLAAKVEMPVSAVGEGGMVSRVLVQPGDWVQAGQVLVTIDRSVQSAQANASAAQINVAVANARIAQSELDRAQALVARGFISKADVERKTATRDAARAQVGVVHAQSSEIAARNRRLDIRAPAAGLVLTRAVEAGQVVGPSSGVLFRIAKGGEIELKAQLSETDLAQLRLGAHADVKPVGSAQSFSGQIWQIAPVIDAQTRQGIARIALAYNEALRPGGFAEAKLALGTMDAPILPESAVLSSESGSYVYVINAQNKVEKRVVKVSDVSDAGIAIGSGLDGSERVVVSAGAFLNPGEKVLPVIAPTLAKPSK